MAIFRGGGQGVKKNVRTYARNNGLDHPCFQKCFQPLAIYSKILQSTYFRKTCKKRLKLLYDQLWFIIFRFSAPGWFLQCSGSGSSYTTAAAALGASSCKPGSEVAEDGLDEMVVDNLASGIKMKFNNKLKILT